MTSVVGMLETWFFLLVWYLAAVNMEETAGNNTATAATPAATPTTSSTTTTTTTTPYRSPVLPTLYDQGPQSQLFSTTMEYVIPCDAAAYPAPRYEWTKNGQPLTTFPENVAMYEEDGGHLYFSPVQPEDEGYYQCHAYNQHGRVLSEITHLKQAKLVPYPQMATKMYTGRVGESLKLTCQATLSVPDAEYKWRLWESTRDTHPRPVQLSARRTTDDQGNLYFAQLYGSEEQNGFLYRCSADNPFLWNTTAGSDSEIMIIDETDDGDRPPQLLFSSESPKVILLNSDAALRCFFSGKPTPKVSWRREGRPMPYGRTHYRMHDTALVIKDVQWEDAGEYECKGSNIYDQQATHVIAVDVQSKPVFAQDKQLSDQTYAQGRTAKFSCEPTAEPRANIQWYINGVAVNRASPGARRRISEDGSQLTISEVCLECADGGSDRMVIQCNASNIHGHALSTGILNIILCENEKEYDALICAEAAAEVASNTNDNSNASIHCSHSLHLLVTSSLLTSLLTILYSHLAAV